MDGWAEFRNIWIFVVMQGRAWIYYGRPKLVYYGLPIFDSKPNQRLVHFGEKASLQYYISFETDFQITSSEFQWYVPMQGLWDDLTEEQIRKINETYFNMLDEQDTNSREIELYGVPVQDI